MTTANILVVTDDFTTNRDFPNLPSTSRFEWKAKSGRLSPSAASHPQLQI